MPLREYLEALPQELYDEIFALTFTADDEVRWVTVEPSDYVLPRAMVQPATAFPHLLHVSRGTRALFAASYYGNSAEFAVYEGYHNVPTWGLKWLRKVPIEHKRLLQKVHVYMRQSQSDMKWELCGLDWTSRRMNLYRSHRRFTELLNINEIAFHFLGELESSPATPAETLLV